MRKLILILILMLLTPVWAFTQTHIFTENEVVGIDSLFQVHEQNDSIKTIEINLLNTQLTNYKKLNEQDSLHIMYLQENVVLLNKRIDLYIGLTKELEPKWFKKPTFQFILGAATIVTSSWVVSNIK
tara:strand:+ start:46 stop:426 length:381 start_codon:yes stop_codon:yes gene_type:complete